MPSWTRGFVMSETQTGDQKGTQGALTGAEEVSGRQASLWADAWRELRHNKLFIISAALILLLIFMAAFPQLFTSQSPRDCQLERSLRGPSADHWFGFDILGCDYYTRVVYGARVSIVIGLSVTGFAVLIALVLGAAAGFYGGLADTLISRAVDIIFGLPSVLGAIVILSVVSNRSLFWVTLVLVVLGWPTMTRLVRSSVLSVRDSDYVNAARALGAGDPVSYTHL